MSTVAQGMLRIYSHLDQRSIEAARNIARWARERGKPTEAFDTIVAQAIERAEQEATTQEAALALMDTVRI